MHPEMAKILVAQRREQLVKHAASRSRTGRWFPRWHVSWTRTVLAPACASGSAGANRASQAGRRGSSLVIIISAHRPA